MKKYNIFMTAHSEGEMNYVPDFNPKENGKKVCFNTWGKAEEARDSTEEV